MKTDYIGVKCLVEKQEKIPNPIMNRRVTARTVQLRQFFQFESYVLSHI
jgi:hypothetical protein